MSSLEEEKLIQMVHDFIESETPATPPSSTTLKQEYTCLILVGILGSCTNAETEVSERALKHVREMEDERNGGAAKKRLMTRLRMDGYDASLCSSSWAATLDCPGGYYEYIVVGTAEKDGTANRLVVDIDFRSQFELARPTSAYTKLSSALPSIFVGSDEKLKRIVSIVCAAAQESLKQSGLHVPPWRKPKYMQAKWNPPSPWRMGPRCKGLELS